MTVSFVMVGTTAICSEYHFNPISLFSAPIDRIDLNVNKHCTVMLCCVLNCLLHQICTAVYKGGKQDPQVPSVQRPPKTASLNTLTKSSQNEYFPTQMDHIACRSARSSDTLGSNHGEREW